MSSETEKKCTVCGNSGVTAFVLIEYYDETYDWLLAPCSSVKDPLVLCSKCRVFLTSRLWDFIEGKVEAMRDCFSGFTKEMKEDYRK